MKSRTPSLFYIVSAEVMTVWFFISIYRETFLQTFIAGGLAVAFALAWVFARQRALKKVRQR